MISPPVILIYCRVDDHRTALAQSPIDDEETEHRDPSINPSNSRLDAGRVPENPGDTAEGIQQLFPLLEVRRDEDGL